VWAEFPLKLVIPFGKNVLLSSAYKGFEIEAARLAKVITCGSARIGF